MFKNALEKLKSLIPKNGEGDTKKKIENLVVFLIILIIVIIAINIIWNSDQKDNTDSNTITYKQLAGLDDSSKSSSDTIDNVDNDLEKRLENILEKINGVGKVNVLITYSETSELVAMYNENLKQSTTEETDTGGGNRKVEQTDSSKDIIYQEQNGEKIPMTQKIINPKLEGAIIIAQGANDTNTKLNIIQAVEAVTGLATHKIQVFEMENQQR